MKSLFQNNTLYLVAIFFLLATQNSYSQITCNLAGSPATTEYGVNQWNAYVYNYASSSGGGVAPGDIGPSDAFNASNYKGFFIASEMINFNLAYGKPSCSSGDDYFSIRYKMKKSFPCGKYTFNLSGDDGFRLSFDGGLTWELTSWKNIVGVPPLTKDLNGSYDMVLEYYESSGNSNLNFNYTFADPNPTVNVCLTNALTPITHSMPTATGIVSSTGLPSGVTASISAGVITLSGTPTAVGTYNYNVYLSPCGGISGTITVNNFPGAPTATSPQTFCNAGTIANLAATGSAIKWYDASSAGNLLTTSTSLSNGVTYYASQTTNGCEGSRKAVVVNLTPTPSATLSTANTSICNGNSITLGGNITATGSWTVNLSGGGGAVSGTGSGTWSKPVSPTATTTYTISSIVNSVCTNSGTGSTTVTLPPVSGSLAATSESATCPVSGTNWVNFYHPTSGNYLGAVNANGGNLGDVTISVNVGTPSATYACNNPGNGAYRTAYMGRNWIFKSSAFVGTNFVSTPTIQLPYYTSELTAMNSTASSVTTLNAQDDNATITTLMLTKFTGTATATEDFTPSNNCTGGVIRGIFTQAGNGNLVGITSASASYVAFGVSQFSEMYLNKNTVYGPLPVTLTHFNATCDDHVTLNWTTASEQNSDRFIVESSEDLNSWNQVTDIQAAGNSNTNINYEASDINQRSGISYYRLVQIDLDGKETIYGPISVDCNELSEGLSVFPNPSNGNFTVALTSDQSDANATLMLTDITGKIIEERKINILTGSNHYLVDANDVSSGTYFVRLVSITQKFQPIKLILRN